MDSTQIIDIAELRKESLVMLRDVKEVLDEGGVRYWLDFGTLLGAIRNGRTTVWDGDFDLSTLDEDIAQRRELWHELKNRGYNVQISYNNIKIEKIGWDVGYYKTDLHRLRNNENDEAEYLYGETYTSKTSRFIKRVKDIIVLSLPDNYNECCRTEFDSICKLIISAGIAGNELEALGPIEYRHGKSISESDFSLQHKKFSIQSSSFNKENKRLVRLRAFFQIMPVWIRKKIGNILDTFLDRSKTIHVAKVCHPVAFFEKFSKVNFHDMTFNAPQNTEEYLERIYGADWRIPRTKWRITKDSLLINKEIQ